MSPSSVPEPSSKPESQTGLPAPPQMPLPEIPQPWLVMSCSFSMASHMLALA